MQLPFFYEDILSEVAEEFTVSKETSKHLIQVLRKKIGDAIVITNGRGLELEVELLNEDRKRTSVRVLKRKIHPIPKNKNSIAVALVKNSNRFEWFLEKATELGIKNIIPMITQRTERNSIRMDRMQAVMIGALIQSRQFFLPELNEPKKLDLVIDESDCDNRFIAHCVDSGDKQELRDLIDNNRSNIVLIGPEGDFTDEEIDHCIQAGFQPVSLGETRLRTETAALKAAVLLS